MQLLLRSQVLSYLLSGQVAHPTHFYVKSNRNYHNEISLYDENTIVTSSSMVYTQDSQCTVPVVRLVHVPGSEGRQLEDCGA